MENRENGQRSAAPGTLLQRVISNADKRATNKANQMMVEEISKCRDTYHVALYNSYCVNVGCQLNHLPRNLLFPYLSFHVSAKGLLYLNDPVQVKGKLRRDVTKSVFQAYLLSIQLPVPERDICLNMMASIRGFLIDINALFNSSNALRLANKDYKTLDTIMAYWPIVLHEGNLYVTNYADFFARQPIARHSPALTVFRTPDSNSAKSPSNLLRKKFFNDLEKSLKRGEQDRPETELKQKTSILHFQHAFRSEVFDVEYVEGEGTLQCREMETFPMFPIKTIRYSAFQEQMPGSIPSKLYALTGGNTELLDRLAVMLANAADLRNTRPKNAVIICSRSFSEAIGKLLIQMFSSPDSKASYNCLQSINKLCTEKGLDYIFDSQGHGAGAIIAKDTCISSNSLSTCVKLIRGEQIRIRHTDFPNQSLCNKLQIIIVSDNPQNAKAIQSAVPCELIDLTSFETPYDGVLDFSEDEIDWMKLAFLPYGLTVTNTAAHKISRKAVDSSDSVEIFMEHCCEEKEGTICSRQQIYSAYKAYYLHLHDGKETPLTEIRFIKAAKTMIGKGQLSHCAYCKIRKDQHYYFVGLTCTDGEMESIRNRSDVLTDFERYCRMIHSVGNIHPKSNIHVEIDIGSHNK